MKSKGKYLFPLMSALGGFVLSLVKHLRNLIEYIEKYKELNMPSYGAINANCLHKKENEIAMETRKRKLLADTKKLLKQKPRTLIEVILMTAMTFFVKLIEKDK
jgi:hypothetical protein